MNKFITLSLLFSIGMMHASASKKTGESPAHQFYTRDLFGLGNLIPVEDSTKIEYCDISGLDKAHLIIALYKHAQPMIKSWGLMRPCVEWYEIHKKLKDQSNKISTIYGYVLDVDLSTPIIDVTFYNEYNGNQRAQAVIATIRKAACDRSAIKDDIALLG